MPQDPAPKERMHTDPRLSRRRRQRERSRVCIMDLPVDVLDQVQEQARGLTLVRVGRTPSGAGIRSRTLRRIGGYSCMEHRLQGLESFLWPAVGRSQSGGDEEASDLEGSPPRRKLRGSPQKQPIRWHATWDRKRLKGGGGTGRIGNEGRSESDAAEWIRGAARWRGIGSGHSRVTM